MNPPHSWSRIVAFIALITVVGGCLFKPTTIVPRQFVLTPISQKTQATNAVGHLAVGVGLVNMPPFLMRNPIAVRKGTDEIVYLVDAVWAERLDQSFGRVLAANLAQLIPTDQVRFGSWSRADVDVSVHVTVERFDVTMEGQGVLEASWRILGRNPSTGEAVRSGTARLTHAGPPGVDPQAIVTTMTALVGELSQALAETVREVAPASRGSH